MRRGEEGNEERGKGKRKKDGIVNGHCCIQCLRVVYTYLSLNLRVL